MRLWENWLRENRKHFTDENKRLVRNKVGIEHLHLHEYFTHIFLVYASSAFSIVR